MKKYFNHITGRSDYNKRQQHARKSSELVTCAAEVPKHSKVEFEMLPLILAQVQ